MISGKQSKTFISSVHDFYVPVGWNRALRDPGEASPCMNIIPGVNAVRMLLSYAIASLMLLALAGSCSREAQINGDMAIDETRVLLQYLEQNGNLVNDPDIPTMISAEEVYDRLKGFNQLIIDLRPAAEYGEGHIVNSVNILPADILHYFEHAIEPNSFEKIVLVCNNAKLSGYVTAVLQFLGYGNVVFMRNGLSSWDMGIAGKHWLPAMSSHLEGRLETTPHPKNQPGPLPAIHTGKADGYSILRSRAGVILQVDHGSTVIGAEKVLEDPSAFYIINYWPKSLYDQGHIAGSIQYEPKASLGGDQHLNTLPVDQPIVIYCYTAHHSVYPVAYLRLLGYDAWHIPYGVNAFIQQTMLDTQPARRSFLPGMVMNYPLVGSDKPEAAVRPGLEMKTETIAIQGGC